MDKLDLIALQKQRITRNFNYFSLWFWYTIVKTSISEVHMDTSIFRYVLEVEKYRNITQAAKRLFISQPALTKQLNKLENR